MGSRVKKEEREKYQKEKKEAGGYLLPESGKKNSQNLKYLHEACNEDHAITTFECDIRIIRNIHGKSLLIALGSCYI